MTIRTLLFAGLLAATASPVLAQHYYGSGYDQRASYGEDERRQVRSVADFEAPLSQYGRWVPSRFGRAWAPRVARDWRPYTVGRWVQTEDGETWDSDEPWGWATYHYGRWGFDERYGWVWSPDTEWAPAWVAWRDGDDYAGWAPLPPQGVYGSGYDDWDYDRWYAPSWIYVQRDNLYRRDLGRSVLPWRSNRNFWDRTRESQRGWNGSQHRDGGQAYWNGGRGGEGRPGWQGGTRPGNTVGGPSSWLGNGRPGGPDRNPGQWHGGRPGITPGAPQSGVRPDQPAGPGGWNGGARPWRNDPRDGRPPAVQTQPVPNAGYQPGSAPGQRSILRGPRAPDRGSGGLIVPPEQNGGYQRPAAQAQPAPPPRPQAQPQPSAQPQPQAEQPRGERPARGDNPRRERDNRQPQ